MAQTKHVTLAAGVVTEITLQTNAGRIEVFNRGVDDVWFTTDETTPVAEADDVHLASGGSAVEVADETSGQNSVIKLLSAGTPKVSVRAL